MESRARFNNYYMMYEKRKVHQFIIDCSKSTTGLFFGIFVLLLTIISLITYFIYKDTNMATAIRISELTQAILLFVSFIIAISIFITFKRVKFSYKLVYKIDYNETLCLVGLGGIYSKNALEN